jgi:hypothetical protein
MENAEDGFLSVLSGNARSGAEIGKNDVRIIQSRLWSLIARQTEAYTMGDSSSVRIETAQELLESICYVISLRLESGGEAVIEELLRNENYEVLYRAGLKEVEARVGVGRALLKEAQDEALAIDHISYHDTLKELALFFRRYNYRIFAHEIPCSIDYQLFQAVPDGKKGIDYINEYLGRLILENKFVRTFSEEIVILLLKGYCPDYREQLINIYEPVAYNAFALTLLGEEVRSLDVSKDARLRLYQLLVTKKDTVPALLEHAAEQICRSLCITVEPLTAYLRETAAELWSRINAITRPAQLEGIFPSLYREKPKRTHTERFIDGEMMDNEMLRSLIDEMGNCRFVSDKIDMVRQNIRSLRDYAEVLNVCFWDEECTELFKTLGNEERSLLLRYARQKKRRSPDWRSETGWETKLEEFVGNMD